MKKILIILILALVSCNDYMSEHYDNEPVKNDILESLSSDAAYSEFYTRIKGTAIENILSRSSAFTLFVPSNEAFAGQTYSDQQWQRILLYHIVNGYFPRNTLFSHQTLQTMLSAVDEYDGKRIGRKDYKFISLLGGKINETSISSEKIVRNGVIYTCDAIIEPQPSIWEYLDQNKENYSYFYRYFKAKEKLEMDADLSINTGFDQFGNNVYDTVYKFSNPLFESIARLNSESDYYTCGIFSDDVFDQATSRLSSYASLPENVRGQILGDAVSRYFFNGRTSQLPFTEFNTSGREVDMTSEMFESDKSLSNGSIYNFADEKLVIDFDKYFLPYRVELEELATFSSGNINHDGLIGGAVSPPANVEHTLSDGRVVKAKRFSHIVNNAANRIPFGVYIKKENVLPIPYTVRWKITKIGDCIDKYNWFQVKEFGVNPANVSAQYCLVTGSDVRAKAKDFNVRVLDAEKNMIYKQSSIITNAELKEATANQSMPMPFKQLRANDAEVYNKIKVCEEIYIEYDWEFDDNRILSNKVYLGVSLELNTKSITGDVIYLDVDYVELIPKVN